MQMASTGLVRVGGAAKATGTTARTIRYYEELGLLQPTRTAARGSRLYSPAELHRIRTIKRLQAFGFDLSDIREMLTARRVSRTGRQAAGKMMERLRSKIREAEEKVAAFQQIKADLSRTLDLVMHWCGECSREPRKECAFCAAAAEGEQLEIGKEFFL
jgi:DNA-binding transcriptional MerR regulator